MNFVLKVGILLFFRSIAIGGVWGGKLDSYALADLLGKPMIKNIKIYANSAISLWNLPSY